MTFIALLLSVLVAIAVLRKPGARRGLAGAARAVWPYLAAVVVAALLALWWYFHRPQPPPRTEALFRGVTYERFLWNRGRPVVVHLARIDLHEPSISFTTTPRRAGEPAYAAMTTSQFLVDSGAQLAVNGDFFMPWWSDGPLDYYPHVGQPTDVLGAAVWEGVEHGYHVVPYSSFCVARDGSVSILEITSPEQRLPDCRLAVSGKQILVDNGAITEVARADDAARMRKAAELHPRTAAALDSSGKVLMLIVVDGRQPGYSEGVTLEELASIVVEHGGYRAMNLDGGGSATMVVSEGDGRTRPLNVPFHTRIPWRERPVPNHLGIIAAPLDAEGPPSGDSGNAK
ncbi:MAG: phosphodiester glycosidase family protein [Polyangiaceae bacterium]